MKKLILLALAVSLFAGPAFAGPVIKFRTDSAVSSDSWTLSADQTTDLGSSNTFTMSFGSNEIWASDPTPDAIIGDAFNLPTMLISNIVVTGSGASTLVSATIAGHPSASPSDLRIVDDGEMGTVLNADIASDGFFSIGATWLGFSWVQDDLDITVKTESYSSVLDNLETAATAGAMIDLEFTGGQAGAVFTMLVDGFGSDVSGDLRGTISIVPVPAPGALLLGSMGIGVVGWLRRRRTRVWLNFLA